MMKTQNPENTLPNPDDVLRRMLQAPPQPRKATPSPANAAKKQKK